MYVYSTESSTPFNLLNELNANCQVHAKVHEIPLDSLSLVLLLLRHEHVTTAELYLICETDTQLPDSVVLLTYTQQE